MEEIWKPVKFKGVDYTGIYEVSNFGGLRNVRVGSFLVPSETAIKKGYHHVNLSKKGKKQGTHCHNLVWSSFVYEPKKGYHIHHKDSNGLNNRLDNLEHITHRQNLSIERSIKSGLPVGVHWHKSQKKYQTAIKVTNTILSNKSIGIGCYLYKKEAAEAYQIALNIIRSNSEATIEEIKSPVSDYRESIGLKRLRTNKKK